MAITEEIVALYESRGGAMYLGEPVTQLAHALQTAAQAEQAGADDSLVVAALLHDIGHVLYGPGRDQPDPDVDAGHEAAGSAWLARHFSPEVIQPVQLHVAAKRYLCAIEPAYVQRLSRGSIHSLALQGGELSVRDVAKFEERPGWSAAVRLRRWDDEAKIPGLHVPDLEHYRALLERLAKGEG